MQCEDNMANSTAIKYKQFQQQIENMQSQLDNTRTHWENSMATTTDATTMAATWRPRGIGPIKLLFSKIVNNYSP